MALLKRDRHHKKGIEWFFNEIRKASKDINYNSFNPTKDPFIGGLFYFSYPDPKTKDNLKYWDAFPLVIPFNIFPDGFIGLNLHYMKPDDRKKLISVLVGHRKKKSTRDYISITYKMLKTLTKVPDFSSCIHRYLNSRVKSRFVKVNIDEWENAVLLPLHKWKKGSPF